MLCDWDDTIAALASAPGPSASGIVRIAGPNVRKVLEAVFTPKDNSRWQSARRALAHRGEIPLGATRIPVTTYLWPTGRSYTGGPMAEIHAPGSPPVLEMILSALFTSGARPARRGEFTLRAFLAGRLDLVQAEAVLGVIDAEEYTELNAALAQLAGGISGRLATVRGDLIDLLSDLEAGLDFVEEDIEFISQDEICIRLRRCDVTLKELREQARDRMQSTGRRRVVLAGLPNAGKSTLFNVLAGGDAALVSPTRGTTRDYLSAELNWRGLPIELIDTAGWEFEPTDIAESAQQFRSEQIERADLIIWCTASDLNQELRAIDMQLLHTAQQHRPVLAVKTKSDLQRSRQELAVSAAQGNGLEELRRAVVELFSERSRGARGLIGTTAVRCRESLNRAIAALERALTSVEFSAGDELIAIEVREVLDELGQILGTVHTDDILDRIFSRFCIGK